jgi:hypothetical protein
MLTDSYPTRDAALAVLTPDCYVEYYAGQWLVVSFTPVTQPPFFSLSPRSLTR